MTMTIRTILLAAILAGPALAQGPATPPPPPGANAPDGSMMRMRRGPMFGNVSEEGRQILREASASVTPEDRQKVHAARDRINDLVAAERLDIAALRAAMEAERKLVDANHAKRQQAMLAAMPKLSAEDRRAFAEDARRGRADMQQRATAKRKRAETRRQRMEDAAASQ